MSLRGLISAPGRPGAVSRRHLTAPTSRQRQQAKSAAAACRSARNAAPTASADSQVCVHGGRARYVSTAQLDRPLGGRQRCRRLQRGNGERALLGSMGVPVVQTGEPRYARAASLTLVKWQCLQARRDTAAGTTQRRHQSSSGGQAQTRREGGALDRKLRSAGLWQRSVLVHCLRLPLASLAASSFASGSSSNSCTSVDRGVPDVRNRGGSAAHSMAGQLHDCMSSTTPAGEGVEKCCTGHPACATQLLLAGIPHGHAQQHAARLIKLQRMSESHIKRRLWRPTALGATKLRRAWPCVAAGWAEPGRRRIASYKHWLLALVRGGLDVPHRGMQGCACAPRANPPTRSVTRLMAISVLNAHDMALYNTGLCSPPRAPLYRVLPVSAPACSAD